MKTSSASAELLLAVVSDFLLWYAKDPRPRKYRQLYSKASRARRGRTSTRSVEAADGTTAHSDTTEERSDRPRSGRVFRHDRMTSQRPAEEMIPVEFRRTGLSALRTRPLENQPDGHGTAREGQAASSR